ncbi:MAG: metallophosphoesterase family protein [Acidobacteria bacterium]|nr:metallophosphoesterase family protein [Acidobacteriota bacterium]
MRILLALLALLTPLAAQDFVGLYLTWSADPATTMTVNWVDLRTTSSLDLHYRRVGTQEWKAAKGTKFAISDTTLQGRRVQLTALSPDSNYEFMIGKKIERVDEGWRFRTMPRDLNRPVHFVAGGDMMHTRARLDKMNAVVGSLDPDFAVLSGDLAYANGVSSARWADWLKSWMQHSVGADGRLIPMVVGIGNHEVRGGYKGKIPEDAPFYYSLFQTPGGKSYFANDFADYLSILALDTDHTEPIKGPQAAWLEQALAARTNKQFQFVTYHYPAYGTTKAPKEGGGPLDAARSIEIRKEWMPHWEKYGVTAVLEHDHHNYKRTHPLRGHKRDDANGILYLGDGAYAVNTRTVPSKEEGWWLAKAEGRNHVWSFRLRADGTALIQAVDIEGKVFDKVELKTPRTKPVGAPKIVSSGGN